MHIIRCLEDTLSVELYVAVADGCGVCLQFQYPEATEWRSCFSTVCWSVGLVCAIELRCVSITAMYDGSMFFYKSQ